LFSPFKRFVSFRYLKGLGGRGEGSGFLRLISLVAVGGVVIGVAALLLTLTIVHGFSDAIEQKIVGFGAHVQVESFRDAPLRHAREKAERLRQFEAVRRVAPVVQQFALLRRSERSIDGAAVWGVERPPPFLEDRLQAGQFDLRAGSEAALSGIVIGTTLARQLGAQVGDTMTVFSTRSAEEQAAQFSRPRVRQFRVTGLYETLLADFDEVNVFVSIEAARQLFGYDAGAVTRFDLTLRNFDRAEQVAKTVEDQFSFPVMARTIRQVYPGLFAWVNLQESIIPLVVGVIVIVAAFNIVGALLMIILEKTSEIGVLASMGASRKLLRRLFLTLGLLIGGVGTVLGEALALFVALVQKRFEIIPLPAEAYYLSAAPVKLVGWDFLIVGVLTLVLCGAAAYLPARFAAGIDPIRVIRFR
jgi:lipoprotein-releasing system permease protein